MRDRKIHARRPKRYQMMLVAQDDIQFSLGSRDSEFNPCGWIFCKVTVSNGGTEVLVDWSSITQSTSVPVPAWRTRLNLD